MPMVGVKAAITLTVFGPASIASHQASCSLIGTILLGTGDLLSDFTMKRRPSPMVATDNSILWRIRPLASLPSHEKRSRCRITAAVVDWNFLEYSRIRETAFLTDASILDIC